MTEQKILYPARLPNDIASREDLEKLTPKILADRVAALVPLIAANAPEAERQRKPVDEVWLALRNAGLFHYFLPKSYGGLEFTLEDMLDVFLPIAEVCASTCWSSSFVAIHTHRFALYNKQAQEQVFESASYISGPTVLSPCGKLIPARGGYRLKGRWKYCSGVMHSDWFMASAIVEGSDPPIVCHATVPIGQAMILDSWHMDGAAGTGSHDVVIENVFVPEQMVLDARILTDAPVRTLMAAMSPVGAARGAVKLFKEYMQKRREFGSHSLTAERASQHMRLAHADIQARAAEAMMRDVAHQMENCARHILTEDCTSIRAQIAQAVSEARRATVSVCEAAGAGAHNLDNPLQRILRDVNTLSSHIIFNYDLVVEQKGRDMVGLPPVSPQLFEQM